MPVATEDSSMSIRSLCSALLLLAGLCCAGLARGDGIIDFFKSIPEDTTRRNCWPKPFIYPDRQAAREPFVTMVSNGWERQNMLTEEHFDAETGKLTDAGQAKVLWILNDAPEQHRGIFVHRGLTPQQTAARIGTVEQFVVHSAAPSEFPPVYASTRSADGYAADKYEFVTRKFQAAIPDPKLMPVAGSSGGGGGSSGH